MNTWKAQLVDVKMGTLVVRYYHLDGNGEFDGREYTENYNFDGSETIAALRAIPQAKVSDLNALDTKSAAMVTKLSAYIGKDIA